MKLTTNAAIEVAYHEGLVRQAYKDSVGVWTWSVGLTNATGHDVKRYIGKPQTLQHCMDIYVWALDNYANQVRGAFKGHDLKAHEFAGALSFHWNTGSIHKASWVKKWKAGDIAGARKSFMAWKKPPEIIPRREAERDLFFDGKWANDGTTNEYTRVRSSGTPDWGSLKRINIRNQVEQAIVKHHGGAPPAPVPTPPQPDDPGSTPKEPAFWAFLIDLGALIARYLRRKPQA